MPIVDFEEFRGCIDDEDADNTARDGSRSSSLDSLSFDGGFNVNWRIPRDIFQEEGVLEPDVRFDKLFAAGHRRLSLDWAILEIGLLSASRDKSVRAVGAKMVLKGIDVEIAFRAEREQDGA